MYVYVYVYVYVCMYVCMCIYIYIYIYIPTGRPGAGPRPLGTSRDPIASSEPDGGVEADRDKHYNMIQYSYYTVI